MHTVSQSEDSTDLAGTQRYDNSLPVLTNKNEVLGVKTGHLELESASILKHASIDVCVREESKLPLESAEI